MNDAPIAQDDDVTAGEDIALTIPVLQNDTDPENDELSVESVSLPMHGSVINNGTSVTYTPSSDYSGLDSFTYTVTDGKGGGSTASVLIDVLPVNDPPVAQDDSQTTQEDSPVTILVLSNDSDPEGDPLRVESISQPENGRVVSDGTALEYLPEPGFSGTDTFTYTIADSNGRGSTARVSVVVVALNDAPLARNDSATTNEGELVIVPILANDTDADGDFLLIESVEQPENGSVVNSSTALSYIPTEGFQGIDTFSYTIADGNGGSSSATVTVSVAEVNESPIAQDDSAITDEGDPVSILSLLNDRDPDGDALFVESLTAPNHGIAAIGDDELIYTPDAGFDGVDTFTYTISDGKGATSTATVFVAVAPVNAAPIAQDDSVATIQGGSATIPVLANDNDADDDPLSISSATQPAHGSVILASTEIIYEPDPEYSGVDTFSYTISDGRGGTSSATVTVGIDPLVAGGGAAAGDAESCQGRVIISEIAWAGTAADSRDEWIELQNVGTAPVDLTGWILRWRSTLASTPEDQVWKVVELSGVLPGARESACSLIQEGVNGVGVERHDAESWLVSSQTASSGAEYFILERGNDAVIQDVQASLIYDTSQTLTLDLSDHGEIVMLLNADGEVVDTANASNLGRNGWVAGSESTRGSMERIDPLKPDTEDNWQTNFGLAIAGLDASEQPLRATPGTENSPDLATNSKIESITPVSVQAGEVLTATFSLSRQQRRTTGWPWISVVRPGFAGISGAGGSADYTSYAFSGSHQGADQYALEIATQDLATGTYAFWIIFGTGEAVYLPVVVSP